MVLLIATAVLVVVGLLVAWGSDIDAQVSARSEALRSSASDPHPKQAA